MRIATLKRRAEFQRVRGGARSARKCLVVEGRARGETDGEPARFGFTITRKIGNAVVRNRVRRRLKAVIAGLPSGTAVAGCDYVIVARDGIAGLTFAGLDTELTTAIGHVNRGLANPNRQARRGDSRPKSPA